MNKMCKCCNEWWYSSCIKQGLCPNCYDYFKELKQQLEKVQQENKILKDIRFLERVVPANSQLHQLSNRECYIKGYEKAITETLRIFQESYGKDKVKLITERDKLLMDIEKVGGYKFQIEELKQQLAEKDNFILNLKIRTPTKLAITELEKVKEYNAQLVFSNVLIDEFINNQIIELKKP